MPDQVDLDLGQALADRARIVLLSTEGRSAVDIAAQLDVAEMTVIRWRKRYRERLL